MARSPLRIGTRGSELALVQARFVQGALEEDGTATELVVIETHGDRVTDRPLNQLGGSGLFIKEIESALLEDRIDFAVHSMKDVPSYVPDGLTLAATTERRDPRDVLVSRSARSVQELPRGATMATGSLRRRSQLLSLRPDLTVEDLRGNVPTRLGKLEASDWEAIVLARAGLERLGRLDARCHPLSVEEMIPAVGQGALGLEARSDDADVVDALRPLNHDPSEAAIAAERAFLAGVDGGCQVPIGAYGTVTEDTVTLVAFVGSVDGTRILKERGSRARDGARELGGALADELLSRGARDIIRESAAAGGAP